MTETFLAGWGAADITPDSDKVELVGQYYPRLARGRHWPLQAVSLVLSRGTEHAALIALDVVGVPEAFARRLRAAIAAARPELPAAHVSFNATHTHNAPGRQPARSWWTPVPGTLTVAAHQELADRTLEEIRALGLR